MPVCTEPPTLMMGMPIRTALPENIFYHTSRAPQTYLCPFIQDVVTREINLCDVICHELFLY